MDRAFWSQVLRGQEEELRMLEQLRAMDSCVEWQCCMWFKLLGARSRSSRRCWTPRSRAAGGEQKAFHGWHGTMGFLWFLRNSEMRVSRYELIASYYIYHILLDHSFCPTRCCSIWPCFGVLLVSSGHRRPSHSFGGAPKTTSAPRA